MEGLKIYSPEDFPSYLPKLNELYDDLFEGGKGFRSKLIQKIGDHLQLKPETIHLLGQSIEFIHNASLLHDDLIDRSELRRGKTTAWLKYTPEYAILAGDYLLARVIVNLCSFGHIGLVKFTGQTISDLLEGEWLQDDLVQRWDITVEELDRVHTFKTSSLFRWCIKAPFMASEQELSQETSAEVYRLLDEMGDILGKLFQRGDDLLDFDVRNGEGKHVLGDLKSGYLNSFAVFLRDQSDCPLEEWKNSISMEELKDKLGTESFDNCVQRFDQINEKLIERYNELNHSLRGCLSEDSRSLAEDLSILPVLLYWRELSK